MELAAVQEFCERLLYQFTKRWLYIEKNGRMLQTLIGLLVAIACKAHGLYSARYWMDAFPGLPDIPDTSLVLTMREPPLVMLHFPPSPSPWYLSRLAQPILQRARFGQACRRPYVWAFLAFSSALASGREISADRSCLKRSGHVDGRSNFLFSHHKMKPWEGNQNGWVIESETTVSELLFYNSVILEIVHLGI